jgi:GTP-binding protein
MSIAIIGRSNVGKSSLFNRLIGARKSLVWDELNVTRDRILGSWKFGGREVELWDLAGWGSGEAFSGIPKEWLPQIELFLFVVDGSTELEGVDFDCVKQLRRWNKPFFVIVNKSDKKSFEMHSHEAFKLSENPIFVSVETKRGIGELEEKAAEFLRSSSEHKNQPNKGKSDFRILILGRPNSGKSSLLNRIVGTQVSFVSEIAGTTRDLVEAQKTIFNKRWTFIDSAGVRKKAKIFKEENPIEIFSAMKALQELKRSDACVLLTEPHAKGLIHTQDKKLLRLIRESQIPSIFVVNKWDTMRSTWKERAYKEELRHDLAEMSHLPIVLCSAKTGFHLSKIFETLWDLLKRQRKISTSKLNQFLQEIQKNRDPRIARKGLKLGKSRTPTQFLKYFYLVQTGENPMRFQIFCNAPHLVPKDERRFLENRLRSHFLLEGLPLEISFRRKKTA